MSDDRLSKLKRSQETGKITIYPEKEVETLYYQGKGNGWDTPKLVRDAVRDAIMRVAGDLQRPAKN